MNPQKPQPEIDFDTPIRIPSEIAVCLICGCRLRVLLAWEYIDFRVLPAEFFSSHPTKHGRGPAVIYLFSGDPLRSIHCETEPIAEQPASDHADRLEQFH